MFSILCSIVMLTDALVLVDFLYLTIDRLQLLSKQSNISMQDTFSNKIVNIRYDDSLGIMRIDYKGFGVSELYREAVTKSFEIAYQHDCIRWLITQAEFRGVSPQDSNWLTNEWGPHIAQKYKEKGIDKRKTAVVKADNVFADYIAEKVAEGLQHSEDCQFFDTEEAALAWLLG